MSEANRCPACGSCVPLAERAATSANLPLTSEMAGKILEDIHKLVTLDCGCVVDGNTVGLCGKHYGNWRVSLGPRKTEEMNRIDVALAAAQPGEPAPTKHKHVDLLEAMRCPDCHSFTPEQVPGSEETPSLGRNEGKPFLLSQNAELTSPLISALAPSDSERARDYDKDLKQDLRDENFRFEYVKAAIKDSDDALRVAIKDVRREAREAALELAAQLAEITIHLSMGPATAEQVCEHLAKQRELIAKRLRALASSEPAVQVEGAGKEK